MNEIKEKARNFLKKYGMYFEDINMEECLQNFLHEMKTGLSNEKSSLQMIPTFIEVEGEIPLNEKVIVLEAGGTNFRAASVYFNDSKRPVIENFKKFPMPGVEKEVGKKEFFDKTIEYMTDVMNLSKNVGFCFSYPTEMLPTKDGKLVHFSKEVKAKEVEGELIGENINLALKEQGISEAKKFILLNDTVATLLGGKAETQNRKFDGYIGFILGTGTNCCYVEKNKNIIKFENLDNEKSQVINIETGGFTKAPGGIIDKEFDATTKDPGLYTFEKMVSGRYIGPLYHEVIKKALSDGLFSNVASVELSKMVDLSTIDVNLFLKNPTSIDNTLGKVVNSLDAEDRILLYHLFDIMSERVALLVAISLSAVVIKMDKGKDPLLPVCIAAEGTTFYEFKSLKDKIFYYIKKYLIDEKGRYIEFIKAENATLIGAAIAGLTN